MSGLDARTGNAYCLSKSGASTPRVALRQQETSRDAAVNDNLIASAAPDARSEQFHEILARPGVRIERIVSTGQSSPPGFWYDQRQGEWVLLLQGHAALRFEDEDAARELRPGDHAWIEAHRRHRVEQTSADPPAVWLAVHIGAID